MKNPKIITDIKHPAKPSKLARLKQKVPLIILVLLVALAGSYLGAYLFNQNNKSDNNSSKTEIAKLVNDLNDIILLPNEEPVVLTVNDKDKVKQQKFFKNTEDGDKVLVFSKQGRAILYRPSEKRIIEVGLVDLSALKAQNQTGVQ